MFPFISLEENYLNINTSLFEICHKEARDVWKEARGKEEMKKRRRGSGVDTLSHR